MYADSKQKFRITQKLASLLLLTVLIAAPCLAESSHRKLTASKIAIAATDPINANLSTQEENRFTEILFEVERASATTSTIISSPPLINDEVLAESTTAVTYAAQPNANRRETSSKIAIATAIPPTLHHQQEYTTVFLEDEIQPALNSREKEQSERIVLSTSRNILLPTEDANFHQLTAQTNSVVVNNQQRKPTPSKIAVNATLQPISSIETHILRDASTDFFLSAPSKTPIAALELMNNRSNDASLNLNAKSALIIDQNSREILYSKNPLDTMPIASITKLMTAMVVLDAKQNLNQTITITSDDIDTLKSTSSRLYVGAKLTRRDLLHLALMSSENRAAHALSRNYPGGKSAFVAAMNAKARQLGMTQTHYVEPTGLSSNNRSTARDLVWLVDAASKYDLIRNLSTSNQHLVTAGSQKLSYTTSNSLVKEKTWDIRLQKTGYIREAGYCLVMQTQIAEKSVIIVLLDADAKNYRNNDATKIKSWITA